MKQHLVLHIVDGDSRSRAEQARTAFALGLHAEVYSDVSELLERSPEDGVILLRHKAATNSFDGLFEVLARHGIWLSVIVAAEEPEIEGVVGAIKAGALDYLELPLDAERLSRALARAVVEGDASGRARRQLAEARRRVRQLSRRERQVLELLAHGSSNKVIARELAISPRTVEIHRANMMTKLRANHSAEAVRLWLQAELEPTVPEPAREHDGLDGSGPVPHADCLRLLHRDMPQTGEEGDQRDSAGAESDGETRSPRRRAH